MRYAERRRRERGGALAHTSARRSKLCPHSSAQGAFCEPKILPEHMHSRLLTTRTAKNLVAQHEATRRKSTCVWAVACWVGPTGSGRRRRIPKVMESAFGAVPGGVCHPPHTAPATTSRGGVAASGWQQQTQRATGALQLAASRCVAFPAGYVPTGGWHPSRGAAVRGKTQRRRPATNTNTMVAYHQMDQGRNEITHSRAMKDVQEAEKSPAYPASRPTTT